MSVSLDDRLRCREYPEGKPVMYQRWSDLFFLHWEFPADVISSTLPEGLSVDLDDDGRAWIGLVPFAMSRIRPRGFPAVPWLSAFLEFNVRTYVINADGRPGVYFYSLDAARLPAVIIARLAFRLPYFHAAMRQKIDAESGWVDYRCFRLDDPSLYVGEWLRADVQRDHESNFCYRPDRSNLGPADPGSLEFFLLERYYLFTLDSRKRIRAGRVHHTPYQFTTAVELETWSSTALSQAGFEAPDRGPDHICWADRVDVDVFALE